MTKHQIPQGFGPLSKSSPFLQSIGPIYEMRTGTAVVIGLLIEPRHANNRAFAHGGLLFTLADLALGMSIASAADKKHGLTVSMTIDFARPVKVGEWVEVKADVQQTGGTLGFASCYLSVGSQRTTRASAVFSMAVQDDRGNAR